MMSDTFHSLSHCSKRCPSSFGRLVLIMQETSMSTLIACAHHNFFSVLVASCRSFNITKGWFGVGN